MITILKGDVYMGTAEPASGGGSPVIDSLNVTPTTSTQTITAPTGTDGYSPVNVSAVTASIDQNITAANIKKDVVILGVTGEFEGSGGGGNSVDCMRVIDNNGNVSLPSADFIFEFPSTATAITGDYAFSHMFYTNSHLIEVDASSITSISGQYAFNFAFALESYPYTSALTTVDFSGLTSITGTYAFSNAFYYNKTVSSIDFSNLTTVSANAFYNAFQSCDQLRTMSYPKLEYIAENGFNQAFYSSGLRSISFGGLKASTMGNVTHPFGENYNYAFQSCSSLTEIHFRADAKAKIQSLTGYADKWGASNATIYFDIAAAVITFDITPAVGNTIYLGGELVSGTTVYTDLDNKMAVISNSSYPIVVKHYTNLQPEQVITTTIDLTQASTSNYIEIQPSESGCTVKFYIDGVEYNPTSVVGDNSRLTLDVDSSVSVGYKVTKSGYQDATGTVTFNNAIVTQSVTMQVATSRTVTLQYPFTTDKSYLEHMITDSSEGWVNGYRIGVYEDEWGSSWNYEALVDNNLFEKNYSAYNFGYITFTTGSETSTLTINANGNYYEGYSGVYISTVSQQQAYSSNDFYNPQFGDGGHWMFYHQGSFQAQDHTETLQANTTYYISFNHVIEWSGDGEFDPGFQINKIQFDVAV